MLLSSRDLILATLLVVCAAPFAAAADGPDTSATNAHDRAPQIRAAHVTGSIRIDGALNEPDWSTAEPATAFTQLDPHEGEPASERTEVRVLVGDDAIYVGARMYDREASKLEARLARRDDAIATDAFEVWIDAYHDHLTAKRFRVNPAGAILDGAIGPDGSEDDSWDAIWEAKARIDSLGWTAEMRIPLSQLRYHHQGDAVWGIQFARSIFRKGETSYFAFTPKKQQGGVSRFGHLVGLGQLPEPRRLELLPYTAGRNERLDFPSNHPFRTHDDYFGNAGADVKYGLTSDLTLDLTVNPDFGQVEVDPAVVNLTAFETFFPERRGFFVEGADLFTFGRSRAFNNFSVPTIFHSRRIGRTPQRILRAPLFNFVDAPDQTTRSSRAARGAAGRWARSTPSPRARRRATSTRWASSSARRSSRSRSTSRAGCAATCGPGTRRSAACSRRSIGTSMIRRSRTCCARRPTSVASISRMRGTTAAGPWMRM